jgi:iron complex transport system substrate-binding protein
LSKVLKTSFAILSILLLSVTVAACGGSANVAPKAANPTNSQSSTESPEKVTEFLTFKDDMGKTVTLNATPNRIVVLAPQFLPMLYELEGKAVGRATTSASPVPKEAESVQQLGTVGQINMEQLLALNPDLVIGSPTFDAKLSDLMASNKIPLALMTMASFNDVKEKAKLFGKLIRNEDKAEQMIKKAEGNMDNIRKKLPSGKSPTFVVMNVTTSTISLQRANTTALEIGELLGLNNFAKDMNPSPNSATSAPYSMEALVAAQPDYIFMVIHGAQEPGKKKIQEDLEKNPAWASLTAVKEKKAMVIPADKFLTNPGFSYDASMEIMAKIVYPEIFGHVQK